MAPLWQPLLWAVLIGSLLAPLNARLSRPTRWPAAARGQPDLVGVLLLFLLPLLALAGAVAAQAAQLLKRLDAQGVQLGIGDRPGKRTDACASTAVDRRDGRHLARADCRTGSLTGTKRLLEVVASSGGAVMLGALGTVVSFILMLFVLFFVLRDGSSVRAAKPYGCCRSKPHLRSRLWAHLIEVTRAVFMGIGLTAIVQGALLGVGFFFAGVPSPLVFGVLAILFALVPLIGTTILWGPAAIWLAIEGPSGRSSVPGRAGASWS